MLTRATRWKSPGSSRYSFSSGIHPPSRLPPTQSEGYGGCLPFPGRLDIGVAEERIPVDENLTGWICEGYASSEVPGASGLLYRKTGNGLWQRDEKKTTEHVQKGL